MTVERAAAQLWGFDPETVTLVARRENTVFRVDDHALRLHRPGYRTDAQLLSELQWMEALAIGGLSVPRPIPSRVGALIETVEGVQVDVLSWLPGAPAGSGPDLRVPDRTGFCHALGRLLADLHRVSDSWTPPAGFTRPRWDRAGLLGEAPVWGRFWDHPDLGDEDRAVFANVRAKADEHLALLESNLDFGLIHADALCENIIVTENKPALIDFDDSGWGFRTFDLATFLMRFLAVPDYADLRDAMLDGYAARRTVPPPELDLFILLRSLTYPGWIMTRMHEPGGAERSARALNTALPLARHYLEETP